MISALWLSQPVWRATDMADIGPIRALVVEDNPGDAALTRCFLAECLGSAVQTSCAERLSEAVGCLECKPFDVVILDLILPDADGLEGLRQIVSVVPDVPVVILSGLDDERIAREALNEGAQEFLVKGSVLCAEVGRAVEQAICRKNTETRLLRSASARMTRLIAGDDVITSARPAEILVIDPAGASAEALAIEGQADCFVLHEARTLAAGQRALARRHYDAILVDLDLPDAWATAVYDALLGTSEDIPVVVLASSWTDPPRHQATLHEPFAIVQKGRSFPDLLRRLLISATLLNRALSTLSEAALEDRVPPQRPNMWRH
jgi:DNA-binding NarL/FixJ family response regulator